MVASGDPKLSGDRHPASWRRLNLQGTAAGGNTLPQVRQAAAVSRRTSTYGQGIGPDGRDFSVSQVRVAR